MDATLGTAGTGLRRPVLEAAADWHVRLKFDTGAARADTEAALAQWLAADAQHRQAWALVQQMDQQLGRLPRRASLSALDGPGARRQQRRTVLKGLLLATGAAGLGWAGREHTPWRGWVAQHRTAPGERRRLALADGGVVELNTATALDVDYAPGQRLLRLHAGEVLVQTATDTAAPARPFLVETPHGRIRALGTRFAVRVDAARSRVAVLEHAVALNPVGSGALLRLEAGQAGAFDSGGAALLTAADSQPLAWTEGMLVAVDQRLDDFLDELTRYRRGRIDCEPAVGGLRITGAYPIDDVDHVLESLTLSHPVRIRHFTRLWTRVAARD